jgi:hypothetical protein
VLRNQLTGFVMRLIPMGDVGPFEATVASHGYLYCWGCAGRLSWGSTTTGAAVFACRTCQRVVDMRRVA